MQFRKVLALRGPNVWASFRVLEAWVDLGPLNESASNELPGFNERLQAWLPSLIEHRCSIGERGGFFERLKRGTYLAHILEHVALELQSLAGTPVGFGRTRQTAEDTVYRVAVEYEEEELGRACLDAAAQLCMAAVNDQKWDVDAEVTRLQTLANRLKAPPAVANLLQAARKRNIPARRVNDASLIQLGWGTFQHRIDGSQTDRTGSIAAAMARDPELTRTVLQSAGVPIPECASGESSPAISHELLVVGGRVVAAAHRLAVQPSASDVTEQVHPHVAARIVDAVRAIGLDVAAVDVACGDIGRPLEQQAGTVVAVRANPDLSIYGEQPVADALIESLFPTGQTGRIPVVGVTGVNGKTTTTRLVAHLASPVWNPVGMACTEGVYVGARRIISGDCSGPMSARAVLEHPDVQAAVLETARGGILRAGLGFDRCDVAVLTNIGDGDHLGIDNIHTPEQLAWVKSTLVAAVAPEGTAVLNAADPLAVGVAKHCRGSIAFFAIDENHPVIVQHRAAGGRTIFVRKSHIILANGAQETTLVALQQVPVTHGGRVGFQVENVLAAVAAVWTLGVPCEAIRLGLESFTGGLSQAPARFNLLEVRGATVILDYGHNVTALQRQVEALQQFPHKQRSIVYSAAGDRRDSDMIRQAEILGDAFDRVILYEDTYMRGRPEGSIFELFQRGLANGSRVKEILEIRGGMKAVERSLELLAPGDLLVIQPDVIEDAVAYLQKILATDDDVSEIDLDAALAVPALAVNGASLHGTRLLEVRIGRLGKSVYASEDLRKGQVLLRGWGPNAPVRTRHSIQVDFDAHIIPAPPLLFLNHSCEPNCGLLIRRGVEEMELHALRAIEAGEELTLDYATFEATIDFMAGPCECRAATCRGHITGYRGMPRSVRENYGQYIAEYLRMRETVANQPVLEAVR